MGTGSPIDFTSAAADEWWREQARPVLELGVEGIKADDGEGYYFPPDVRFADGRTRRRGGLGLRRPLPRSMQRALDEVHGGDGVLFGRCGWTGQQAIGKTWGGDQASDFWSLRTLVTATLTAAASGYSNWSHDVGGYLGERLVERCPKELLVRWAQFGCFTPLMQAHGRFEQEAWTYDPETLAPLPRSRAAARAAGALHPRGRGHRRPLRPADHPAARLIDPADPRAGPSPTPTASARRCGWRRCWRRERASARCRCRAARWIDFWTGSATREAAGCRGGAAGAAPGVRARGSIVVTYPADHVAQGLGDTPEAERPLEATLWGEPRLGRAGARLADGTRVRWHDGELSVTGKQRISLESEGKWRR